MSQHAVSAPVPPDERAVRLDSIEATNAEDARIRSASTGAVGLMATMVVAVTGCAHGAGTVSLQHREGPAVGFMALAANDRLTGQPLKVAAFYPPAQPVADGAGTDFGPYHLDAVEGVPPAAGRHPVIILSHGHSGSRFGHHDLGEALARAGFVVAAVEHAGDSWNDQSGVGTDRVMYGRAYQVAATLDAVAGHPVLGPVADVQRAGVAGFSAGGYTALTVAGAKPDFSLLAGYCQRHPADGEICALARAYRPTLESPAPMKDPRVKGAFVMAPLAVVFGPQSFVGVDVPVALTDAAEDRVLLPSENAQVVRAHLKGLAGDETVTKADHYVFVAPCSKALAEVAAMLCVDPEGVDRSAVHRRLNARAVAFFEQLLAAP